MQVGADLGLNVVDLSFQGGPSLTLDGKGRLTVPSCHLAILRVMEVTQLTITKHPNGQLMVFPRPVWIKFRSRLEALPMEAEGWKRVFLGNAKDVDIDATSRVLVPPELRKWAGLERDVVLAGIGSHMELWDAERRAAFEAETMKTEMPESIKSFTF